MNIDTRLTIRQTFLDWEHTAKRHVTGVLVTCTWCRAVEVSEFFEALSPGNLPRSLVAEVIDELVYDGVLAYTRRGGTLYIVRA